MLLIFGSSVADAQPGSVVFHQKISFMTGGFTGLLDDRDWFGMSVTSLGDLDGDGVGDLAIGARLDDDGGSGHGAVWVTFLNSNGTVKSQQKISDTQGGFAGSLNLSDFFGTAVTSLGDLDGDGIGDLAVGAMNDDDGAADSGAVWVLFLNRNGTVKSHQKISALAGGFTGVLDLRDSFGVSVASLGDLDGDGVGDLAVGAEGDDDGGLNYGAVWVLFLNTDGTVKSHQKISSGEGGFTGVLHEADFFGRAVGSLSDLDGDGVRELAAGAPLDDDGGAGEARGAVWVLRLNSDGTVKAHQKISVTQGGFNGRLEPANEFGSSVNCVGDLDGDGIDDMAVGAIFDNDGGSFRGAVWVLFLNADGTVKPQHQKISSTQGNFTGILNDRDRFGSSVVSLGDLNGDGVNDMAVGAAQDDDGGRDRGAIWVMFLDGPLCYADCDQSTGAGVLDIFDFLCFQTAFVTNNPYACDCTTSTGPLVCDVFDFLCFQNSFVTGCP
jgi:FG-GAP repeat